MRYSSALVLSTLAVGQAAAAHNARHASFHARRQNEASKRGDVDYSNLNVDWSKVDYPDWSKVDWKSVYDLKNKQSTPTPAPTPPASSKESKKASPTPPPPAPEPTANPIKQVGDFLEGLADGIEQFCKDKGISAPGKNDRHPNGGIWLGKSDWSAEFTNAGSETVWLTCWIEGGFTGAFVNAHRPDILIRIPSGKTQTLSFAPKVATSCAPFYPSTKIDTRSGIVYNTWLEMNFGPTSSGFVGTFDVSRNPCMNGDSISAVSTTSPKKCKSDMETCVFKCKDTSVDQCTFGYDLFNCHEASGGGGGYDPVMGGTGGGCSMGAQSENLKVTLKNRG